MSTFEPSTDLSTTILDGFRAFDKLEVYSTHSSHRGAGLLPQGWIGTEEVEFFGLPSISLSE